MWREDFETTFDNGEIYYHRTVAGSSKNEALSNYLLELAGMTPEEEPAW